MQMVQPLHFVSTYTEIFNAWWTIIIKNMLIIYYVFIASKSSCWLIHSVEEHQFRKWIRIISNSNIFHVEFNIICHLMSFLFLGTLRRLRNSLNVSQSLFFNEPRIYKNDVRRMRISKVMIRRTQVCYSTWNEWLTWAPTAGDTENS